MIEKVNFYSNGFKMAAKIYIPDDYKEGEKRAAICISTGYCGTMKKMEMIGIANWFMDSGYVAIIWDPRGFGESEGQKGRIICMENVEDAQNAISYLIERKEVDKDRIGECGISVGGGYAAYVSAIDKRIKCTCSMLCVGDGERWMKSIRTYPAWLNFLKRIEEDRGRRALTGKSEYVKDTDIMPIDPIYDADSLRWWEQFPRADIPLETGDSIINFKPELIVDRISPRPIYVVHPEIETLVPCTEAISMYEHAKEPKKLWIVPKSLTPTWQDVWNPDKVWKMIMNSVVDWFKAYIPPR